MPDWTYCPRCSRRGAASRIRLRLLPVTAQHGPFYPQLLTGLVLRSWHLRRVPGLIRTPFTRIRAAALDSTVSLDHYRTELVLTPGPRCSGYPTAF